MKAGVIVAKSRKHQRGRFADTLKNRIAGDMKIAILTAVQATSTGKIADSAKIARSLSTVISITERKDDDIEGYKSPEGSVGRKLRVVYNRNGAQHTEDEFINFDFYGSQVRFAESKVQPKVQDPF